MRSGWLGHDDHPSNPLASRFRGNCETVGSTPLTFGIGGACEETQLP